MSKQSFWNPVTTCMIAGTLLAAPDFGWLPLVGVLVGLFALRAAQQRR